MLSPKLRVVASRPLLTGMLSRVLAERYEIDEAAPGLIVAEKRGLDLAALAAAHPGAKIVVLDDDERPDPGELLRLLRGGADGYVRATAGLDVLLKMLELVVSGETIWLVSAAELLGDRGFPEVPVPVPVVAIDERRLQLSPTERSVLLLLQEGSANKVIAKKLGIAEATVKVHVKAVLRKLRVNNRTQAALWAARSASQLAAPTVSDVGEA
jgi:DNA-binding NarL/FixJ family response regulator